jgi:hypothetical protein
MAVFRHGDLGGDHPESCSHRITFEAFEATVTDLARCLKPGGYLVIDRLLAPPMCIETVFQTLEM